MPAERRESDDEEIFPAGEDAPADEDAADPDAQTFPAGVESDEGKRPGDQDEDEQPGMLEDPPRAD